MAYTRALLRNLAKESGVELPKELEDALISEHTKARDAHAEEEVRKALENAPKPADVKIEDSEAYKILKKEYEDYKAAQEGKEARSAKEAAVRAIFESRSIKEGNLKLAMGYEATKSAIEKIELDETGRIKDTKPIDDLLAGDLSAFVGKPVVTGAPIAVPPPNNGGNAVTRADIMKIKDTTERQAALAQYIQIQKGK